MIPNNTKSGIISIIRFSGEKKHSTFSAASLYLILSVNTAKLTSPYYRHITSFIETTFNKLVINIIGFYQPKMSIIPQKQQAAVCQVPPPRGGVSGGGNVSEA